MDLPGPWLGALGVGFNLPSRPSSWLLMYLPRGPFHGSSVDPRLLDVPAFPY